MAEKRKRYEPSIKVALREARVLTPYIDEDVLEDPTDAEVMREFEGLAHADDYE